MKVDSRAFPSAPAVEGPTLRPMLPQPLLAPAPEYIFANRRAGKSQVFAPLANPLIHRPVLADHCRHSWFTRYAHAVLFFLRDHIRRKRVAPIVRIGKVNPATLLLLALPDLLGLYHRGYLNGRPTAPLRVGSAPLSASCFPSISRLDSCSRYCFHSMVMSMVILGRSRVTVSG